MKKNKKKQPFRIPNLAAQSIKQAVVEIKYRHFSRFLENQKPTLAKTS